MRVSSLFVLAACSLPAWARAEAPVRIDCPAVSEEAQRLRQQSKYREARERFQACADAACPAVVRKDCAQWQADLEVATPTIVVAGLDENEHDVVDAELAVDGVILATRLDGKPLAVDPGSHELRLTASQRVPVTLPVVIREGEKNRVVRLKFASKPVAAQIANDPPAVIVLSHALRYSSVPPAGAVVVGALGFTMMVASAPFFAAENGAPLGATLVILGSAMAVTGGVWWVAKARTSLPSAQAHRQAHLQAHGPLAWRVSASPLPGGGFVAFGTQF